jgi:hypothetical protein
MFSEIFVITLLFVTQPWLIRIRVGGKSCHIGRLA